MIASQDECIECSRKRGKRRARLRCQVVAFSIAPRTGKWEPIDKHPGSYLLRCEKHIDHARERDRELYQRGVLKRRSA